MPRRMGLRVGLRVGLRGWKFAVAFTLRLASPATMRGVRSQRADELLSHRLYRVERLDDMSVELDLG